MILIPAAEDIMHICPQRVFLHLFQNLFRSFSLAFHHYNTFFTIDLSNCVVFDLPNAASDVDFEINLYAV